MNLRRLVALALLGGLVSLAQHATATVAFAQDEEDPEPEVSDAGPTVWDRMLAVQVTGGYDTPYGVIGAALEFSPHPWVTIYAGGGVGRFGGRFAGGLQLQVPVDSTAFGIQAGFGGGALEDATDGAENARIRRYWAMALYFHSAFSVTYRFEDGIFGRLSLGMNALVAGDPDECVFTATETACGVSGSNLNHPVHPFAGLTVGYAFDL